MMPSLRAGKVRNAALGEHVVHHQQQLAMAADGERLHRGDPRLLDALAAEFVGRRVVGEREPAIDLVHVTQVALQVPDERDPAVIEVGEIDAGAEHAAPLVLRMLDHRAAHDRDLGRGVEQRQVDADLRAVERGLVLGVEEARIVLGHHRGLAGAMHRRAVELDHPSRTNCGSSASASGRGSSMAWQRWRPARSLPSTADRNRPWSISARSCRAAAAVLGGDLLRGRHQARHHAGGARHQVLDPHEARPPHRERVVDGIGVPAQETRMRASRAASWISCAAACSCGWRRGFGGNCARSRAEASQ